MVDLKFSVLPFKFFYKLYNGLKSIYIYIERERERVTLNVTLNNVTLSNNLLLVSYFEIFIIRLHILYVLNIHANFHINQILFII